MNPCLPDWNFECDLPFTDQRKPLLPNHGLMELLYRNGQVVAQSQTHRRSSPSHPESTRQPHKQHDHHQQFNGGAVGNLCYGGSGILGPDAETVSWIEYPVEDSFEKDFSSHFLMEAELPAPDPMETDKSIRQFEEDPQQSTPKRTFVPKPSMPPPRIQLPDSSQENHTVGKVLNFAQFSAPIKCGDSKYNSAQFGRQVSGSLAQGGCGDIRECSVMTVGSSHCGSNQVLNDPDLSRATSSNCAGTGGFGSPLLSTKDMPKIVPHDEGRKTETIEPTITSSSGGSGSSLGGTIKNSAGANSLKRKSRDVEDSECQSEAAELESAGGKKSMQRSTSTRRSRAAEVHNLSERRRRDRINKKMRALQELIPHCNKTDKASMLDEAIEYLKSLQLQLQVMWMGSSMAPMMFPGMQHYMSPMSMGMGGPHHLATVHNNMHLPRVSMVDQSLHMASTPNQNVMCQTPILNPANFQNQMQNNSFPEQFARYMGMHQMQAATSQPRNMFRFGPQALQPSQMNVMQGAGMGQFGTGASSNDALSGKMG